MGEPGRSGGGQRSDKAARGEASFASLFTILWDALADLLGTAATATLVRRATQRAARRCPELGELVITRTSLQYSYNLPAAWKDRACDPPLALRELASELRPLLFDLTGTVVLKHLERIPELGLVFAQGKS